MSAAAPGAHLRHFKRVSRAFAVYAESMERMAWTDDRLDDLSRRMDAGFERVDRDIRDLRGELHTELTALRVTLLRVGGAIVVGLVGVIAAVLAGGG